MRNIVMTQCQEVWVDRKDFRKTKAVTTQMATLAQGCVRLGIEKFALTANNVGYAVGGDFLKFWHYFPCEDNWGHITVWGLAEVLESNCGDISVGERLYGFFPMSSHLDLEPGDIQVDQFTDMAEHRQVLTPMYNHYRRTQAEPAFLTEMEVERCLLFPLFTTSYVLYDYLTENAVFDAEQIIIGSVSSKTGFGLAKLLHDDPNVTQRIVGMTSASNVGFVKGLGCCDQVLVYGEEAEVEASKPAAYVDMSGDVNLTKALHNHLGDNILESCMVGATHWEGGGDRGELPGAKPQFFFAPAHIAKRDAQWGAGEMWRRGGEAGAKLAAVVAADMTIEWTRSAAGLQQLWLDMLDNKIPGKAGQMVSLL